MSVTNLMYIKEDLIIPHGFSFHDLIVNKVRENGGAPCCADRFLLPCSSCLGSPCSCGRCSRMMSLYSAELCEKA